MKGTIHLLVFATLAFVSNAERKKAEAFEFVGTGYCRREDCEAPCLTETLLEYMPMCATYDECLEKCKDVLNCKGFSYTAEPLLNRDGCISLELGHCIIAFSDEDYKVAGTTTNKKTNHYGCWSFDREKLEEEEEAEVEPFFTTEELIVTIISLGSILFLALVASIYYYNKHRKESERMRRLAINSAILGNTKSPVLQHLQAEYNDLPNQKHKGKKNMKQIMQAKKLAKQKAKEKNVREVKALHEEHLQNAAKQHEVHSIEHALQTMKFEEALAGRRQARRNKGKKKKKKDKGGGSEAEEAAKLMEEGNADKKNLQMMNELKDKEQHDKLSKKLQARQEKKSKKSKAKIEFVDDDE